MAVEGKKKYQVYLTESNVEYVRSFLDLVPNAGGLSGVIDGFIKGLSSTLRASGYREGDKLKAKTLLKIGINGLKA